MVDFGSRGNVNVRVGLKGIWFLVPNCSCCPGVTLGCDITGAQCFSPSLVCFGTSNTTFVFWMGNAQFTNMRGFLSLLLSFLPEVFQAGIPDVVG